ncbi:MAG: hypothetical protein HYU75_00795 [Betaproteobacteria bacterium]|nr:hypothetical protein [Betaproteobacteria bacterium]
MALEILRSLFRDKFPSTGDRGNPAPWREGEFIAFVTFVDAPHFLAPDERLASDQASMRLRVGLPARELAHRRRVCLVPIDYLERDPGLERLGTVRAIVVGKPPVSFFIEQEPRARSLLEWIEATAQVRRIVVDFSDDLEAAAAMFSRPALLEFQERLLRACPATVPSGALRARLARHARHGITVIEDPYESARAGKPRFAPGAALRLAWFGAFGPPLRAFVEAQFRTIAERLPPRPAELAFVTYASQAGLVAEIGTMLLIERQRARNRAVRHRGTAAGCRERLGPGQVPQPAGGGDTRGEVRNGLAHPRLCRARAIRMGRQRSGRWDCVGACASG